LHNHNDRLWAAGALVSNVGTWMQRVAQDWLVLTQLTHHDASAVGTVMALQFGPQLLLLPWTGGDSRRDRSGARRSSAGSPIISDRVGRSASARPPDTPRPVVAAWSIARGHSKAPARVA
jgi:hypothetical protein